MLTDNICTPWGLCNGSMGIVYDIVLDNDNEIKYIIVQFEDLIEDEMIN